MLFQNQQAMSSQGTRLTTVADTSIDEKNILPCPLSLLSGELRPWK